MSKPFVMPESMKKLPPAEQDKLMKLASKRVALELFSKKHGLQQPSPMRRPTSISPASQKQN